MPHASKWREDNRLGVRPRRTGVLAMHACLEGVQALHALQTGVHSRHACPARRARPARLSSQACTAGTPVRPGMHGRHACPARLT
ncbi:hypothetical protein PCANC_25061 [Puccinia coronata f. sp. avenae]|uniref:Uncharacterized protein n=1 Tax=Puccinia coronata f. sp. avenae TaxID=200324 RepID=A0A2N5TSP1_9BASI|nr:hypothetical protein PCANC_25061 [Puccinia coronata f. sp. avenae]